MDTNTQPITGKESLWGDYQPSQSQLKLVNASPTFISDIHTASDRIDSGAYKPIAIKSDSRVQFDLVDKRVVLTPDFLNWEDTEQMGTLSHELGHFLDDPAERAFAKDYGVNPRDPDAHNQAATLFIRAQTVAEANQWKIAREVEQNTATPGNPGTKLSGSASAWTGPEFDALYAKYRNTGLTDSQLQHRLTTSVMGTFAGVPSDMGAGSEYNRKHSRKVARMRELPLTSRRPRLPMTQLKTLPRAMMPELAER